MLVVSALWKGDTHFWGESKVQKLWKYFKKQKHSWKYELPKIFLNTVQKIHVSFNLLNSTLLSYEVH